MFAYALILILVLPVTFMTVTVENSFSAEELNEMGIQLENQSVLEIR